jgi:hypothetical protein
MSKFPRYEIDVVGKKLSELPPVPVDVQEHRMRCFREIVAASTAKPVQWITIHNKRQRQMVDLTTAGYVCAVYDKLSDTDRSRIMHLDPPRLIARVMKLLKG